MSALVAAGVHRRRHVVIESPAEHSPVGITQDAHQRRIQLGVLSATYGAAIHVVSSHCRSAGDPRQRYRMRLLHRCGEIHTGNVGTVYRHIVARRRIRISGIAGSYGICPVCQTREAVAARRVRNRRRPGGSAQGHGGAAATRSRTDCPGDGIRGTLRSVREIYSGDVGAADRCSLAGRTERVTGVARSNRVSPVCQSSEGVRAGAVRRCRSASCST